MLKIILTSSELFENAFLLAVEAINKFKVEELPSYKEEAMENEIMCQEENGKPMVVSVKRIVEDIDNCNDSRIKRASFMTTKCFQT